MDLTSPEFANKVLADELRDAIAEQELRKLAASVRPKHRKPIAVDVKAAAQDKRRLVRLCKRVINEKALHDTYTGSPTFIKDFYLVVETFYYDVDGDDDTVYYAENRRFAITSEALDDMDRTDRHDIEWSDEVAQHACIDWKDLGLAGALAELFPYHHVKDHGEDSGILFTYMHPTYKIFATIPTAATKPNAPIAKLARLDGDCAIRRRVRDMLTPKILPKKT